MKVIEIGEDTSAKQAKMGWFDQYTSMMNGPNVKDIILAVADNVVVATALTYTPSCGSPIPSNLPWAGRIGDDVGGVTCICISREYSLLHEVPCLNCNYVVACTAGVSLSAQSDYLGAVHPRPRIYNFRTSNIK